MLGFDNPVNKVFALESVSLRCAQHAAVVLDDTTGLEFHHKTGILIRLTHYFTQTSYTRE
jgi:hypothetical protein